jgi:hypothetical protein
MISGIQTGVGKTGPIPGLVYTGCELKDAAHEPARLAAAHPTRATAAGPKTSGNRREVTVNGKRVKTIDVHCHCVIPKSLELMGMKLEEQRGPGLGEVGTQRIAEMNDQGIDVEALSINPAHGGGFLPSYAARSDNACRVGTDQCNPAINLKKKPTEYLRDMYFDTLVFTSEALRHLAAEVGTSQLVVGTHHPIPWHQNPVDHIMNTPGFTDEERIAMLGGTAAKLLKID